MRVKVCPSNWKHAVWLIDSNGNCFRRWTRGVECADNISVFVCLRVMFVLDLRFREYNDHECASVNIPFPT